MQSKFLLKSTSEWSEVSIVGNRTVLFSDNIVVLLVVVLAAPDPDLDLLSLMQAKSF